MTTDILASCVVRDVFPNASSHAGHRHRTHCTVVRHIVLCRHSSIKCGRSRLTQPGRQR
ncbi:hypothetical protein [Ornithinimicrobium kibberense]|uniref:hypothetical protein n=1 Tax=Ornithinimicrobium kibberense TaxID=282060 RepID=UPI0036181222